MSVEAVEVKTADGVADGIVARPEGGGSHPGVIVLTDIMGMRPAYVEMAEKVAAHGYSVLVPNLFYRWGKPPIFEFPVDFEKESTGIRMKEITAPLTPAVTERDGSAFIDFLVGQPFVSDAPIGVVGFCYAGKYAFRLAAVRADRIRAAASFHGGGLATEDADSPHLMLPSVKAELYFGHAENDRSMPVEAIARLDQVLAAWGGKYESETYPAGHGWMIPGRPVHNPEQAERGFAKLLELFDRAL